MPLVDLQTISANVGTISCDLVTCPPPLGYTYTPRPYSRILRSEEVPSFIWLGHQHSEPQSFL
ncbi:hypothetical protein QTP88_002355 [Uroleucon formosanum]